MVVVGRTNTRKTSTIRALTGAGRPQPIWYIAYTAGIMRTYVHPPALQEVGIAAANFIAAVQSAGVDHVIVALRQNQTIKKGIPYNDAATYLADFVRAGWVLNPPFPLILGNGIVPPTLAPYGTIPIFSGIPANQIAARARTVWGIS